MRILVIGAGLFGTSAALVLADDNSTTVDLVESEQDIMLKASNVNHNRLHLGYHYLRSIETAEQSIEGLLSFLFNFGEAVLFQFPNYYAIAKDGSKVTPDQFISFCDNVGIGYDYSVPETNLLNPDSIQACFKVPEPVWDYSILKNSLEKKLSKSKINLYTNTKCIGLRQLSDKTFEAKFNTGIKYYDVVINCTYACINELGAYLGVDKVKLLFEDVMIPMFKYPSFPFGLTVMDGPFCSVMPKGKKPNEFLLYHVKESVLNSILATKKPDFINRHYTDNELISPGGIYHESSYFMPFLKNVVPNGYNRTIRTVYENSDDARLTELYTFDQVPNFFTILSGKVTTCMQVALEIKHTINGKNTNKRFRI